MDDNIDDQSQEKPIDEDVSNFMGVYNERQKPAATEVNLPFEINIDKDAVPIYDGSIKYAQVSTKPVPGSIETFVGAATADSEIKSASRFLDDVQYKNPFYEPAEPGWSIKDELGSMTGLDSKYLPKVMKATNHAEARRIYADMLDRQEDDNRYKDGSQFMQIMGGLSGPAINPSSWFPIARAAKLINFTESMLLNTAKALPGISMYALSHNAWQNTFKEGGNMEDFISGSAIDAMMATVFAGGGFGLSHGVNALHLYNARESAKMLYNGIETKAVINNEGEITGMRAVPMEGESISAAKVDMAQQFLDSEMAKNGLFKVPVLSGLLGKGAAAVNPIVRGLTSEWETLRGWTNAIASHSIETKGISEGREAPRRFDEYMTKLRGENQFILSQYNSLYLEAAGIKEGLQGTTAVRKMIAKMKDSYLPPEKFDEKVQVAITEKIPDANPQVNQAANMYRKESDDIYKEWRILNKKSEDWLDPVTARGYLGRDYLHDQILTRPEDWEVCGYMDLKDQDQIIEDYMSPIKDLSKQLKTEKQKHELLKNNPGTTNELLTQSVKDLESKTRVFKSMKEKLQNELRSNTDLSLMLEDRNAVSANEAREIKKYTKPVRDLEKLVSAKSIELKAKEKELFVTENRSNSSKDINKVKELSTNLDSIKKEVQKIKDEIKDAKNKIEDEKVKIQELHSQEKINSNLYNEDITNNQRTFKDHKNRLKFRKKFKSDEEIKSSVNATRITILGQTNEETLTQMIGDLMGHVTENHIKNRSYMVRDKALYEHGFTSKNVSNNLAKYRIALGRQNALKKSLAHLSINGGIEPLAARLTQEYHNKVAKVSEPKLDKNGNPKNPTAKQTEASKAEIRRLTKSFESAKEDLKHGYNRTQGRNRMTDAQRKYTGASQTFAAMTKLGLLPLTGGTEIAAISMKHGFWPSIRSGLIPIITTLNGLLKSKKSEIYKKNASAAWLANNHLINAHTASMWSSVPEQHIPMQGKIISGLDKAANVTANFNLTSYAENFTQSWTANVIQSEVIRFLLDHENGKLKPNDKKKLLMYGLNPEKVGKTFLKEWRNKGSDGNGWGAYESHYWEWDDTNAANEMAMTINAAVRDTVLRKGILDAPFFADTFLGSFYSTFKGWTYASGTRYLMPLLQNPTPQKILGTALMMGAGAMQDPLYRFARGEKTDPDDDHALFWPMITNSGVFSLPAEAIQEFNIVTGGRLLPGITNERMRNRTIAGIMGGPQLGQAEDLVKIIEMSATSNYNESDMKRINRMTPIVSSMWFQGLANKWVESWDLPKTYNDAKKE